MVARRRVEPRHTIAMVTDSSVPDPVHVRVCHAEVAEFTARPDRVAWWRDRLAPEHRVRYDAYRRDSDRDMFLLGRALARTLVGRALGVSPHGWPWREGARGRPEVDTPDCRLRFNLAHSAGRVACVLAHDRDVGVDLEDLQRRPVEPAVVTRYCAPAEAADVQAAGQAWHDRFLHYWTLKEAYLKARGLGIAVQLAHLQFRIDPLPIRVTFLASLRGHDDRWTFYLTQVSERHLVAVAAAVSGTRPTIVVTGVPAAILDPDT